MDQEMTQEELCMYEKLYELMGARVRVTSDNTVYQGIIGSITPGLRMVSLRHTTLISGDYLGVTRFRFREITSLTVIESGEVVNRYPKNDYLIDILKNKVGKKYNICNVLYDGQLSDPSDDEKSVDEEESTVQDTVLEVPPHLKSQLPSDFVIIDFIDENFTQAIQDILKQNVIGVSFSGPQISRFGKLTSLCISTMSHVYLFDMVKLDIGAFDNGLRDILEAHTIKKVIHDCRFPSDCLAHEYYTQLTNVFDTQVADFVINMQRYNDKYEFKFVSSLDCCLRNHLHVPPEFLYKHVKTMSDNEKSNYFSKRPISNEFRSDLIKDALYLVLLQETLARKLLDPLHKNVSVYLGVLANATDEEINTLGSELCPPESIPPSILMYGIQTVRFNRSGKKSVSLECKFIHPKTGEIVKPMKTLYSGNTEKLKNLNLKCVKKMTDESYKKNCTLQVNSECQITSSVLSENNSSPLEKCEKIDTITMIPSFRHIDEVYHKLVNNLNLRSQHSESVINVKPSANYVSKFTFRKPFCTHLDMDSVSENSHTSETISDVTQNSANSSEFWTNLCHSSEDQNATPLSLKEKYKNIQFVPA